MAACPSHHGARSSSGAAPVTADRQILVEHTDDGYGECVRCADEGSDVEIGGGFIECLRGALPWPCRTVRLLAEAWGWTENVP